MEVPEELKQTILKELETVQIKTLDATIKMVESLLTNKQGFDLDDYTITQCANLVRNLRDRIVKKRESAL
jgi:hypothetical protein